MLQSFFAGVSVILASMFGGGEPAPTVAPSAPIQTAAVLSASHGVLYVPQRNAAEHTPDPAPPPSNAAPAVQYVTQPIIERQVLAEDAITREELDAALSALRTDLLSIVANSLPKAYTFASPAPAAPVSITTFAHSQRIDQLGNVTITNATVSGVTGLTDADIPNDVTASNYLPLSGGTLTGDVSLTNATSTNLFATLGHFTAGIIDSLTATAATFTNLIVTTITGTNLTVTNATTTNATSTNLFATNGIFINATTTSFYASGTSTLTSASVLNLPFSIKGTSNGSGNQAYDLYMTQVGDAVDQDGVAQYQQPVIGYGHNRDAIWDQSANLYIERLQESPGGTGPYTFNAHKFALWARAGWPAASTSISSTNAVVTSGGSSAGNHAPQNAALISANGFGDTALEVDAFGGMIHSLYVYTGPGYGAPTVFPKYVARIRATGSALNDSIGLEISHSGVPANGELFQINNDDGGQLFKVNGPLNAPGGTLTANGAYSDLYVNGKINSLGAISITGTNGQSVIATNSSYLILGTTNNAGIYFDTNGLDRLYVSKNSPDLVGVSAFRLGWANSSSAPDAAIDTNISRVSAGILQIGTTATNALGSLNLTNLTATGNGIFSGNLGIATTTPWRTLSVTGTVGFDGLSGSTGGGSLCLSANREVVYNSGSDSCLSSTRTTKHDVNPLVLDALAQVVALQPVSFIYNSDTSSTVRYGFIAEDAAAVDAHLATYDAQGTISGIDDRSIISVVVKAIQQLRSKVESYFTRTEQLEARVAALEAQLAASSADQPPTPSEEEDDEPDTEAPTIVVNGSNPATIEVGDTYADLGATVTDNVDLNLGLHVFVGGTPMDHAVLDTSEPNEWHIHYVATDNAGNTATSTRTVIVEASSIIPADRPVEELEEELAP